MDVIKIIKSLYLKDDLQAGSYAEKIHLAQPFGLSLCVHMSVYVCVVGLVGMADISVCEC